MTAQFSERLRYEGEELSMCCEPLGAYFRLAGIEPGFMSLSSALWRGYLGTWEIRHQRLYFVGLQGRLKDGSDASVSTLFPDFPERVFAHWYSGELRLPRGKMLEYAHMGYGSIHEEDLFLTVSHGVVNGTRIVKNGTSDDPDAPEGYGVGAMTVFGDHKEGGAE